jgi:hypothetical protein
MISYRVTAAALGIVLCMLIFWLVRRDLLQTRFALKWLFVGTAAAVLGVFPTLVDRAAGLLGVSYPPALLFVLAVGVLAVKILLMDMDRSRIGRQLAQLEREIEARERAGKV